ncbi:MAG: hypothetical protein ACKO7B_07405, partial [Flavobacteriales bacterium]
MKTGVYQIRHSDLLNMGLNMEGKSSGRIRMYGSGGKQLSEASQEFDFGDIREIPVQVEDGGDGVFNQSDRVLFYGEDPHSWQYNKNSGSFEYSNNIYSDSSYYFITLAQEESVKRVLPQAAVSNPEITFQHYPERWVYAPENVNVLSLGRIWYADVLDFNTSKSISFPVADLHTDSLCRLRFGVMARSGVSYSFNLQVNGVQLDGISPPTVNLNSTFGYYGRDATALRFYKPDPGITSLNVTVNYQKAGNPESIGYINFIEVSGWRKLSWAAGGFGFRSYEHRGKRVSYNLSGLP